MGTTKYNEGDIILLTVIVLDISAFFYGGIAFKFAVKDHYQDLRGKVLTDVLDDSGADLLNALNDELISMIGRQANLMADACTNIYKIYNLASLDQQQNERVTALAEELYWQLMDDEFPWDEQADDYDDAKYLQHLMIYVTSLIRIVKILIKVIIYGEIDDDEISERNDLCETLEPDDYSDQVHVYALAVLSELGVQLNEHQEHFYEYYFNQNAKPDENNNI
ncbi:hypothetical protein [Pedobacter hartonius]|nr:hypothetical protein [Pedobacter hartonius]